MGKNPNKSTAKVTISLEVNGEHTEVAFAPHKTLLEVLREDLGLTGTKHGCELGECGTCAVLVDGQPVLSCLVLGLASEGRSVKTIEGMADGPSLHPLQETFADLGAAQLPRNELLRPPVENLAGVDGPAGSGSDVVAEVELTRELAELTEHPEDAAIQVEFQYAVVVPVRHE